jgi:hypothetical protein
VPVTVTGASLFLECRIKGAVTNKAPKTELFERLMALSPLGDEPRAMRAGLRAHSPVVRPKGRGSMGGSGAPCGPRLILALFFGGSGISGQRLAVCVCSALSGAFTIISESDRGSAGAATRLPTLSPKSITMTAARMRPVWGWSDRPSRVRERVSGRGIKII